MKKKIIFNKLSEQVAVYLKSHRINEGVINDFFEYNSNFIKNELRNVFNGLYNEALTVIPDATNKSDEIFFIFMKRLILNILLLLMLLFLL